MIHKPPRILLPAKNIKNLQRKHETAQKINYAAKNRKSPGMTVFQNLKFFFTAGMASKRITSVHEAIKMNSSSHKNRNKREAKCHKQRGKAFVHARQNLSKNEPSATQNCNHNAHKRKSRHHITHILAVPVNARNRNRRKHAERNNHRFNKTHVFTLPYQ